MTPVWLLNSCAVVLGIGWLALLFAPMQYRAAWVAGRSCAMLIASASALWWLIQPLPFELMLAWPGDAAVSDQLPSSPLMMLAWLQLSCFSLFIGSWMVEDAPLHDIPHRVTAPLLVATALTGPIGWASYMLVRDWYKWRKSKSGEI